MTKLFLIFYVEMNIALLGSPSYKIRELATSNLEQIEYNIEERLKEATLDKDLEVAIRSKRIIAKRIEDKLNKFGFFPEIYYFYYDRENKYYTYYCHYQDLEEKIEYWLRFAKISEEPDYSAATKNLMRELMEEGESFEDIDLLMSKLRDLERFVKKEGAEYYEYERCD